MENNRCLFFLEKLDWINVLTLRKKLILTPVSNSNEIKEFLSIEELMGKLKTAKVNPLYFTEEEYILAKNFFDLLIIILFQYIENN